MVEGRRGVVEGRRRMVEGRRGVVETLRNIDGTEFRDLLRFLLS